MTVRVAVYYTPAPSDPLWTAASAWLGRDAETGGTPRQPDLPGIAEVTAEPRLYGFHATLKPPMRLRASYGAFIDDAGALAARLRPFPLPPLAVQDLRGFLALRETEASAPLQAMADACVRDLDSHRVLPDEAELARRRGRGLGPAQDANLLRWGYPHVFETWFFHMTLTRRIDAQMQAVFRPAAESWFADALSRPRIVDALTIFTQAGPGAPFMAAERLPFGA